MIECNGRNNSGRQVILMNGKYGKGKIKKKDKGKKC